MVLADTVPVPLGAREGVHYGPGRQSNAEESDKHRRNHGPIHTMPLEVLGASEGPSPQRRGVPEPGPSDCLARRSMEGPQAREQFPCEVLPEGFKALIHGTAGVDGISARRAGSY